MKTLTLIIVMLLALVMGSFSCELFNNNAGIPINEDIWVNAYLVSWEHNPETEMINTGSIKTSDIDWDAMTHLTYFSLIIAEDGTPAFSLDPELRYNFNSDRLESIVQAAHDNGVKVLFSVGGDSNYEELSLAISADNRTRLIETIVMLINDYGFDGVDLNMTKIENKDFVNYKATVRELSSELDVMRTKQEDRPLLTASAVKSTGVISLFREVQQYFDQINILTFNMSQPWRGWQAYHNAALYNKSAVFENKTNKLFPSVDGKVNEWILGGLEREKIGIAINFYGSEWEGVNYLEKWSTWPTENMSLFEVLPYHELSEKYDLSAHQWDNEGEVPYLNGEGSDYFVSFENEKSISSKIMYAKKNRIGGVMIWDLSGGFNPTKSPENPLLNVVKPHIKK